jgi:AcrR family transcriptional regulator
MTVTESRRESIVEAMVRVVGRRGYRRTTVGDAIAEAGASRTTFYKYFDDKHDCFLAAYDLAAERILAAVAAGCDGERPWRERARGGLYRLVELLAIEPELARIAIVEVAATGADARRRQWETITRLAQLLDAGHEDQGPALPANTGLMAASAVAGLLFDEVQAGRVHTLQQRLPDLLFALLVPYLGPSDAAAEVRRAVAYPIPSR